MDRGKLLKELRENKKISQKEAAEHIGVLQQTLYKYENNIVTNIPSDIIEKMAVLYETTPGYIMGWESDDISYTIVDEKMNELFEIYQSLTPDKQAEFSRYLKFLQSDL